jgi:hypothetical protein
MSWPDGWGTQLRVDGRARDLSTDERGATKVLAEDSISVGVAVDRTIEDMRSDPPRASVAGMVGATGGGRLRAVIDAALPEEREAGTPLYLLLDDLAGATLIAPFAWSRTSDDWMAKAAERIRENPEAARHIRRMEGICAGFRPGSSALSPEGTVRFDQRHNVAEVPPLVNPDDPEGWHDLLRPPEVAMRRARRIDVSRTGSEIAIDAMFRDSCWQPDGSEVAVHEYGIAATMDAGTGQLTSVRADPRVLPYAECPAAAPNAEWMIGVNARDLRTEVLNRLRGVDCCTHLNDALRALAEIPMLADALTDK